MVRFFVARYHIFSHGDLTGWLRDGHEAIALRLEGGFNTDMNTVTNFEFNEQAGLPLRGYIRLYETHLKSERKTSKTIQV